MKLSCQIAISLPAFDRGLERYLADEMRSYQQGLDDEMQKESEKHQRQLDALNKRKEEIIRDKKNKLKVHIQLLIISCISLICF